MSNSSRRILAASLAGTAIEFYDFYIYATAASLVFGFLFFPKGSPSAQLMAAYASFALAFLARPLGSVVFGHFGDRVGRKSTLVASLLLMGGSTVAIGLLPVYQLVGWVAPALLCLLRFGQGFGLGGEWGGAALLAVENAPPGWRARWGMFPPLGAPVGFFVANGVFWLLGKHLAGDDFMRWGWRVPFLASSVLVFVGLWVRLKLTETPDFKRMAAQGPLPHVPLVTLFREHLTATIAGTMAGRLFAAQTWVSLGCGLVLLIGFRASMDEGQRRWPSALLGLALAGMLLALLSEFAVAPHILARDNLALWHSLGSGMYLGQWLLSALVLWQLTAPR